MPDFTRYVREKLGSLHLAPEREAEIVEEIAGHIRVAFEETRRRGVPEDEALALAERPFVPWSNLREQIIESERTLGTEAARLERGIEDYLIAKKKGAGGRLAGLLSDLWHDLRFAVRSFRRRPGFTLVAVLTLGLGIGATTAIFSIVDGVLLRKLPYPEARRLVSVWTNRWSEDFNRWYISRLSYPEYLDWQEGVDSFESVALYVPASMSLRGFGAPLDLECGEGTATLLDVLGVSPLHGRWFQPEECGLDPDRVVVLGHALWREHFGSDPDVLGSTINLENQPFTVIGVMPAGFRLRYELPYRQNTLLDPADTGVRALWVPLGHNYGASIGYLSRRNWRQFEAVGRLRPGVSLEQAMAESESLLRGEAPAESMEVEGARFTELENAGLSDQILLLAVPSLLLLLIACGNMAALLLGEAVTRRHEVVTRIALGAGTRRIVRQLLSESILLGVLGSAIGAAVAIGGVRVFTALAPASSRLQAVETDLAVLLFASAVGVAAGLLSGLAPAVLAGRKQPAQTLRAGSPQISSGGQRGQDILITVQVALTVMLLVVGGLFTRTLVNLSAVDVGFEPGNLIALGVALDDGRPPEARAATYEEMMARIATIPGVDQATGSMSAPFLRGHGSIEVEIDGITPTAETRTPFTLVMPGYHETMRIPLLAGRLFNEHDRAGTRKVVIVSESTARRFWPDESPVGTRIWMGDDTEWSTVIGVVGDVINSRLDAEAISPIYATYLQDPGYPGIRLNFLIRTPLPAARIIPAVRTAVRQLEPELLVNEAQTISTVISQSAANERYRALLILIFALAAVLLAGTGIYGVTARRVAQRVREFGIRMTLGATRQSLVGMMLRQSLTRALAGIAIGLLSAYWISRSLTRFFFEVIPSDSLTYVAVVLLLVGVCVSAGVLSTRRISSTDPIEVLRAE